MKAKFPDQTVHFASCNKPRDIRSLSEMLVSMSLIFWTCLPYFFVTMELTKNVDIAKRNPHATEMNVLVVGMPNVGKSTLLNSLRNMGIPGREFKTYIGPKNELSTFTQEHQRHYRHLHSLAIHAPSRPALSSQKTRSYIHTTRPV
jgi:ribosome biogenesis GTPase A